MTSPAPPSKFRRRALFLLQVLLYVGTGILQPLIVDRLRMTQCLGRQTLLLPTLVKTAGMALVGLLSTAAERDGFRRRLRNDRELRRFLLSVAAVDLSSGMLLTGGLFLTGAGTFVVLYNSTPAWTALLSKYFLGRSLATKQTVGVTLVCVGLIVNVVGTTEQLSHSETAAAQAALGSLITLVGCVLHAAFFVLSDRSLRGKNNDAADAQIPPTLWSSCLGSVEMTVMSVYVAAGIGTRGFQPEGTAPDACTLADLRTGLGLMLLVDALHSAAFFLLMRRVGAVGSALLKGTQSVAVVLLSAAFSCPREEAQCLTPAKGASVGLVVGGTLLYAAASSPPPCEDGPGRRGNSEARGSPRPSLEMESFVGT